MRSTYFAVVAAAILLSAPFLIVGVPDDDADRAVPDHAGSSDAQLPASRANGTGSNASDPRAPGAPTNLHWFLREALEIHWDAPADAALDRIHYYEIYWGVSEDDMRPYDIMDGNFTWYPDYYAVYWLYVLDEPSVMYYAIAAINDFGRSPLSEVMAIEMEVDLAALDRLYVRAPFNMRAEADLEGVSLTWESPYIAGTDDILGFRLYREGGGTSGGVPMVELSSGTLSYRDENIITGLDYSYHVTSFSTQGESQSSEKVRVNIPAIPSQPHNLHTMGGEEHIDVYWSPPVDDGGLPVTAYRLYRADKYDDFRLIHEMVLEEGQNPPGVLHYKDKDVDDDTRYTYTVSAVTDAGESDNSHSNIGNTEDDAGDDGSWRCLTIVVIIGIFLVLVVNWFISRRKSEAEIREALGIREEASARAPPPRSGTRRRRMVTPDDLKLR